MTSLITAIPGLSALYAILTRQIGRKNSILTNRQSLAREVAESIEKWAELLNDTFLGALSTWEADGKAKAQKTVNDLIRDFIKVRYSALRTSSPILRHLAEDERFEPFATASVEFYQAAIETKRLVYGQIETSPGEYLVANSASGVASRRMIEEWLREIERKLNRVQTEYDRIRTIAPT